MNPTHLKTSLNTFSAERVSKSNKLMPPSFWQAHGPPHRFRLPSLGLMNPSTRICRYSSGLVQCQSPLRNSRKSGSSSVMSNLPATTSDLLHFHYFLPQHVRHFHGHDGIAFLCAGR